MGMGVNFFYGDGYGITKPVPAPLRCHPYSPCTSNTFFVPPKVTIMLFIKILVKVGRDAVNFIYCIANFSAPQYYFFSRSFSVSLCLHFKFSQFHFKRNSYSVPETMKQLPHSVSKKQHVIFMKRILASVSHL